MVAVDGGVAVAIEIVREGELTRDLQVVGRDIHMHQGLVFGDEVDVDAEPGEGGIALSRGHLPQHFIVRPVLLGDVDDIADRALRDSREQGEGICLRGFAGGAVDGVAGVG